MAWNAFDLNLLVVFDAVEQEKNLTRAGLRLGMSQPAVSHALARLRHLLKDELFVRTPAGMRPTPRAERMVGPSDIVHPALIRRYARIVGPGLLCRVQIPAMTSQGG